MLPRISSSEFRSCFSIHFFSSASTTRRRLDLAAAEGGHTGTRMEIEAVHAQTLHASGHEMDRQRARLVEGRLSCRPWRSIPSGSLDAVALPGYGSSTALITCTIPLDAEMSVAAIPAASRSERVSVSPLSIRKLGPAGTMVLLKRPLVTWYRRMSVSVPTSRSFTAVIAAASLATSNVLTKRRVCWCENGELITATQRINEARLDHGSLEYVELAVILEYDLDDRHVTRLRTRPGGFGRSHGRGGSHWARR